MKTLKEIQNRIAIPGWLFALVMVVFNGLMLHLYSME